MFEPATALKLVPEIVNKVPLVPEEGEKPDTTGTADAWDTRPAATKAKAAKDKRLPERN